MEHMGIMNDPALKEVNEYPDLDYTPNYPWVGAVNESNQLTNYTSREKFDEYPVQAVGSRQNEPWHGSEENLGALGQSESSEDAIQSLESQRRRSDDAENSFDDPDFELSDKTSMYA